jgi:hypothetical protein
MLELGNQHIKDNVEGTIAEKTGKEYYQNRGVLHTSVDLNGMDGALKVDLSKPVPFPEWLGYFDIITNLGTSEHVEPKAGQYECFMNVHNCLKVGGIAVHMVPDFEELENRGCWKNHCNNYYSREFFKMLVEKNDYKLISLTSVDGNVWACVQKQRDVPFMKNREEFLGYIIRKQRRFDKFLRVVEPFLYRTYPIRERLGLCMQRRKEKS